MSDKLVLQLYNNDSDPYFCPNCSGQGVIAHHDQVEICGQCYGRGNKMVLPPRVAACPPSVEAMFYGQLCVVAVFADAREPEQGTLYYLYQGWFWHPKVRHKNDYCLFFNSEKSIEYHFDNPDSIIVSR
jgi:ribosomal protein S27AE